MFKHALVCVAGLVTLAQMDSAAAHVTLEKRTAVLDSSYKAVLRIPHGCEGEATHTVRVTVPEGFVNAKPMPKPGWTLATRKARYRKSYTLHGRDYDSGVVEITWSGGALADDWYDEFVFRGTVTGVAPGSVLHFPTTQLCATGENRWHEVAAPGEDSHRLEWPAPYLTVIAQTAATDHAAATASGSYRAGTIVVEQPWARASLGSAKNSAAYLSIRNAGAQPDRLIGVFGEIAAKIEIHRHIDDGGIMRMRRVDGIDIPAGGTARLQPGGFHIMLIGLHRPLNDATSFPLTLKFENAGDIPVTVDVRKIGQKHGAQEHRH